MRVRETAAVREVVLSEIAWAGTSTPTFAARPDFAPETSSDEWLELRNTTGRTIDLTGWTLTAADGTPNIVLRGPSRPTATTSWSAPLTAARRPPPPTRSTPARWRKTNGEDLTLSDGVTAIDRVDAWYAGDTAFHTMQRVDVTLPGTDPAAWADGPIDGAPQNSLVDADADILLLAQPEPGHAVARLQRRGCQHLSRRGRDPRPGRPGLRSPGG